MTDLVIEMNAKMKAEERRIQFENRFNMNSNAAPSAVLRMKEEVADEWASRAYQIYCDVWKAQGNMKTSGFVRTVYARGIRVIFRGRAMSIAHEFSMWARRKAFNGMLTQAHLKGLDLRMRQLENRWFRKLEAEAKELEHSERRERLLAVSAVRKAVAPSPPPTPPTIEAIVAPPTTDSSEALSRKEIIIRKVRNPDQHIVVSVEEAQIYYEVTPRTIYRWVLEGKLQKGGRRGSITVASIHRWNAKRARKKRDS